MWNSLWIARGNVLKDTFISRKKAELVVYLLSFLLVMICSSVAWKTLLPLFFFFMASAIKTGKVIFFQYLERCHLKIFWESEQRNQAANISAKALVWRKCVLEQGSPKVDPFCSSDTVCWVFSVCTSRPDKSVLSPCGFFILPGCTWSWCSPEVHVRLSWICPLSALEITGVGRHLQTHLQIWNNVVFLSLASPKPPPASPGTLLQLGVTFEMIYTGGRSCFIATFLFQY